MIENRSKAWWIDLKPTLRCLIRACARRTVFCSEPSTSPAAPASPVRGQPGRRVGQGRVGHGEADEHQQAGASLMVAAPGAGWPIARSPSRSRRGRSAAGSAAGAGHRASVPPAPARGPVPRRWAYGFPSLPASMSWSVITGCDFAAARHRPGDDRFRGCGRLGARRDRRIAHRLPCRRYAACALGPGGGAVSSPHSSSSCGRA